MSDNVALEVGTVLGYRLVEPGRWRVATVGGRHVELLAMIFTTRVVETPVDCDYVYGRFWCYSSPLAAAAAVEAWDKAEDTEPVGWVKAWDGRRNLDTGEPEDG